MQQGVSDAGYFSRHSTFLTANVTLHEDPNYSCDTVNLHTTHIQSQRDLDVFVGRFMKVKDKKYTIIKKDDKHLIGTTIQVRSPATCASKEEGKICRACYGFLFNVNYGMHAGLYAAIDTNENKTQLGLSAKHALATSSAEIEIIDEKMFLINENGWLFTLNENIDMKNYELVVNHSDVYMENKENYERYDNYFLQRLVFRHVKTGEIFEVYEKKEIHFYLSSQLFTLLKDKKFFSMTNDESTTIPLKEIDTESPLVFLRISNDELTKPIKQLTKFIQKGEKPVKGLQDYDEFITVLNKMFRQGGMNIPSVHIEMIIRNLVRSKDNVLKTPDWSKPQTPDMYKLTSMNKANILSSSVIAGLMFEEVKEQLRTPLTYQKTEPSIYSLMFINE